MVTVYGTVHVMVFSMINVLDFWICTFEIYAQRPVWLFFHGFLDVLLCWYVGQIFSERFWDGSICRCCYWYVIRFCLPRTLYLCFKVLIPENLSVFLDRISRRVRKIAKKDLTLSCLSVRMEQLGSHWSDFNEIWYFSFFLYLSFRASQVYNI